MEIIFSELDQQNPYLNESDNPYLTQSSQSQINKTNNNYWEQPKVENPKRKKVSFDDILTNMNLIVSKDGTLQSMIPKSNLFNENYGYEQQPQQYTQQPQQYAQQYAQQSIQYKPQYAHQQPHHQPIQYKPQYAKEQEPLDPSVKHSYIYNKYFKDYRDANTPAPSVRVPKTMEEYKKMLLEDRLERMKQQKRISEIKSTKLFFTTNNGGNGPIHSSRNNLKSMSFR